MSSGGYCAPCSSNVLQLCVKSVYARRSSLLKWAILCNSGILAIPSAIYQRPRFRQLCTRSSPWCHRAGPVRTTVGSGMSCTSQWCLPTSAAQPCGCLGWRRRRKWWRQAAGRTCGECWIEPQPVRCAAAAHGQSVVRSLHEPGVRRCQTRRGRWRNALVTSRYGFCCFAHTRGRRWPGARGCALVGLARPLEGYELRHGFGFRGLGRPQEALPGAVEMVRGRLPRRARVAAEYLRPRPHTRHEAGARGAGYGRHHARFRPYPGQLRTTRPCPGTVGRTCSVRARVSVDTLGARQGECSASCGDFSPTKFREPWILHNGIRTHSHAR